jgi:hypothetical protein
VKEMKAIRMFSLAIAGMISVVTLVPIVASM